MKSIILAQSNYENLEIEGLICVDYVMQIKENLKDLGRLTKK